MIYELYLCFFHYYSELAEPKIDTMVPGEHEVNISFSLSHAEKGKRTGSVYYLEYRKLGEFTKVLLLLLSSHHNSYLQGNTGLHSEGVCAVSYTHLTLPTRRTV